MNSDHKPSSRTTKAALVSVVIVNYNYGRYLKECIESVLSQHYQPLEVIVVDDGSTDDSRRIIQSYCGRLSVCFKPNGGVISATNAGFAMSRGPVVIFVDADDYMLPGAVAVHAHALLDREVVRSQRLHDGAPRKQTLGWQSTSAGRHRGRSPNRAARARTGFLCVRAHLRQRLGSQLSGTYFSAARESSGRCSGLSLNGCGPAVRQDGNP